MTEDISAEPDLKPGIYEHYKGNRYRVHGLACHSEALEWYVVYEPLYEHEGMPGLWVRPYAMFIEDVEVDGVRRPRFRPVDS
jgi:hypothetical protein